jgi:hypothetical protein
VSACDASSGGILWVPPTIVENTVTTDENGYYKIRFAKRINGHKVERYRFYLYCSSELTSGTPSSQIWDWNWETSPNNGPFSDPIGYMYPSDLKGKETIVFDTIKYYKHIYYEN